MNSVNNPLESALPLALAAQRWLPLSRSGKPIATSVLWRWAENGIRVGNRRIRLKVTRIGGQRYVTREDLQKFLDALNAEPEEGPTDDPTEDRPPALPKPSRAKAAKNALASVLV